ncbi:MAG: metallophosphoesterase family protein, partial [Phycisphaeraceae bacterium]
MKVGVISDTHDRLPPLRRAVALFERLKVGALFHAGDFVAPFAAKIIAPEVLSVPLHCIYGNNDGEREGLKAILPNLVEG